MKQSQIGSELTSLLKVLERIVETIKSPEQLSDFERGQRDGLLWAIQLAEEIKTPLLNKE